MSFLKIHGAMVRVKGGGFSSADLLAAMTKSGADQAVTNADEVGLVLEWVPGSGEYERPKIDDDDASSRREFGSVRVLPLLRDPQSGDYSLGDGERSRTSPCRQLRPSTTANRDLLAVGYTVVKLLYLQGRIDALPAVYRCIERSRQRSKEPMQN